MKTVEAKQRIKVIIVDDEPISCDILRRRIQKDAEIDLVAVCSDGKSAVSEIQRFHPDLIFLDVEMPWMDGFEVLGAIRETPPLIVFVTAYDKYAVRAFEMNAVDYLLKPFYPARFVETLKRAKNKIRLQRYEQLSGSSLNPKIQQRQISNNNSIPYVRTMMIQAGARLDLIQMKDVLWIAASNQYVYFHLESRSYLKRDSLNRLESCLDPAQFVRVHRSAMVNVNFIKYVKMDLKGSMHLVLTSETKIRVSRLRKKYVRFALQASGSD